MSRIREMNKVNNGEDICIEECVSLAREGLVEFPGNEALLFCLAKVLYNAGYARYGEHHLTDEAGYDIFDVESHKAYAEWKEAKVLFEKLVKSLPDGEMKQEAILLLTRLYVVTGEHERSMELIQTLPDVTGSYDMLILNTCDGKKRAEANDKTITKLLCVCAELMCSAVMQESELANAEAIKRIQNGLAILEMAPAKDAMTFHGMVDGNLYLSTFLWREGDRDGALAALDRAYEADRQYLQRAEGGSLGMTKDLPSYWPCWCVPDYGDVEAEIKADPGWAEWVRKCNLDN